METGAILGEVWGTGGKEAGKRVTHGKDQRESRTRKADREWRGMHLLGRAVDGEATGGGQQRI
jgi:hypothetical protein